MNTELIIDINADVGEGIGNEAEIIPLVSSSNIACGGHAGDIDSMTEAILLCKKYGVKIGAHPSFPDKVNFGRQQLKISCADLYTSLIHQIRDLQDLLYIHNQQLHHVKPHGALYNLAAKDEKFARVIIEVIKSIALPIKLYAPYTSVISKIAKKEFIEVTYEAFADRNYNSDLSLVSRNFNNAVITEKERVLEHVLLMVKRKQVRTFKGEKIAIKASTFCVHGDTENAISILNYLHQNLPQHQIKIL